MFPQRFYVFTLSFHLGILEISSCDSSYMETWTYVNFEVVTLISVNRNVTQAQVK